MTAPAQSPPLGWSFLVARGRRLGYRCLLAPDFLVQAGQHGVISDAVTGDTLAGGAVGRVTIPVPDVGLLTLAYQIQQTTVADLRNPDGPPEPARHREGHETGGLVTDEHGRPLELLYGIVCAAPGLVHADARDLQAARAEALRTYRRFLVDEAGFAVETSRPFPLRSSMAETAAAQEPPPSPGVPESPGREPVGSSTRNRPRLASIVGLLLTGALMVLAWTLIGPFRPVKGVDVEDPTPASADCSRPVSLVFHATVTTRRAATVTYHWEGTHNTDSRPHELVFERGASRPVSTTLVIQAAPGEEIRGEQRLVVDQPNRRQGSVRYRVPCDG